MHEVRRRTLGALAVASLTLVVLGTTTTAGAVAHDTDPDVRTVTAAGQLLTPERIARASGRLLHGTLSQVTSLLATDPAARLDGSDRLLFADHTGGSVAGPSAPARAVAPLTQTFTLHSRPNSKRTIYLDFDGERVCDTGWNRGNGGILGGLLGGPRLACGSYEGFRGRTSPGAMSAADLTTIQDVWSRVSEDFAPFDVDVTTERPNPAALERTNGHDQRFGVHAVVSASTTARNKTCGGPGCAGVAYVGVFPKANSNDQRIFWAFAEEVGNDPRRLADVLSHEAGHTLGLLHDGARPNVAYYAGHGIWGPIMGSGDRQLTQWSRGEYAGADETQDDLAVIAEHGAAFRRDDHSNRAKGATRIRRGRAVSGVVSTPRDIDAFRFATACRGPVRVRARNAALGPNLDIALTVRRPGARKVRRTDPLSAASGRATGLDAGWRGTGPRGKWLVTIDGVGARDPLTTGYSDYGSLGNYTLVVKGRCVRR